MNLEGASEYLFGEVGYGILMEYSRQTLATGSCDKQTINKTGEQVVESREEGLGFSQTVKFNFGEEREGKNIIVDDGNGEATAREVVTLGDVMRLAIQNAY